MSWLVLAIVLVPRLALAFCVESGWAFAPPTESELPSRPRIFVFVPTENDGGTFTAAPGLIIQHVTGSKAFQVYELRLAAPDGDVTVRYVSRDLVMQAHYTIGHADKNTSRVVDVRARLTAPIRPRIACVCPRVPFVELDISGSAIAYRFDWHASARTSSWSTLVPATDIRLGHVRFGRFNVELDEVHAFDLIALYADGNERRLGSAKMLIDDGRARLPVELVSK